MNNQGEIERLEMVNMWSDIKDNIDTLFSFLLTVLKRHKIVWSNNYNTTLLDLLHIHM